LRCCTARSRPNRVVEIQPITEHRADLGRHGCGPFECSAAAPHSAPTTVPPHLVLAHRQRGHDALTLAATASGARSRPTEPLHTAEEPPRIRYGSPRRQQTGCCAGARLLLQRQCDRFRSALGHRIMIRKRRSSIMPHLRRRSKRFRDQP
jgi:hypothetical protein